MKHSDGQHYRYTWDAFGRLCEVRTAGSSNLVTKYRYNGLGFRITETYDTDTSGTVDGSDSIYHFVYDAPGSWRIVATYRDDDANPKEQFVHHCAGAGGYGSSSYIDAVILRDVDLSTDWDAQADALDARHYYCQNWRADVSVIIDDSAVLVERVMYSPYGVPFGIPVGDIVSSGGSEPASGTVGGPDINAMSGYLGSSYNIADFDNDGDVDTADETILSNNNGASIGWFGLSDTHNRLGYAGYVFDEALAGTKWHVRHRVLESVLGRWISRDPLGYVDGISLQSIARSSPLTHRDPTGLKVFVGSGPIPSGPSTCGSYGFVLKFYSSTACNGPGFFAFKYTLLDVCALCYKPGDFVDNFVEGSHAPPVYEFGGWAVPWSIPGWTASDARDRSQQEPVPGTFGFRRRHSEIRLFCLEDFAPLTLTSWHLAVTLGAQPSGSYPTPGCPSDSDPLIGDHWSSTPWFWNNARDAGSHTLGSTWNCCCSPFFSETYSPTTLPNHL